MRVDDEDVYQPRPRKERSGFEWLTIITLSVIMGTLAADVVRLLAVNAWANYQLEQIAKANRESQARAEVRAQNALQAQNQQRLNMQRAREEQVQQRAFDAKFNSDQCKFWRDINAVNPSEKSRKGLAEHCP